MAVKAAEGIEIKADWKLGDLKMPDEQTSIVEAVVTPQSRLVGRTLKEASFHQQSGLDGSRDIPPGTHLAGERSDRFRWNGRFARGARGEGSSCQHAAAQGTGRVVRAPNMAAPRKYRGVYAVALFGGTLLLNLFNLVPLAPGLLTAAVLCVMFRCISVDRAYQMIDWRLLILIGE